MAATAAALGVHPDQAVLRAGRDPEVVVDYAGWRWLNRSPAQLTRDGSMEARIIGAVG